MVSKKVIYTGKKLILEVHTLEGGFTREVVVHNGAVAIVPFLDADTILLIQNRRYTVGQVLWEIPAGTLEKGEPPIDCAGRELQEETGYVAGRLTPIGSFYTSPGILSEKMYAFAAYDLTKTAQALEAGEEIQVQKIAWSRAMEMIRDGTISDGKTIAALLMMDRFDRGR